MKRAPRWGIDLGVYVRAIPLLVRNPAIVVVPLLMAVVGVLIGLVLTPSGGGLVGSATSGIGGLIVVLLRFFGVGTACIIADEAWRRGRASFDNGWTEARRRGGDILYASLGITFLFWLLQYASTLIGLVAILLTAVAVYFLIWAIPAAAVGGIRGGDAIQVSIDRVRANPLPAAIAAVVTVFVFFAAILGSAALIGTVIVYTGGGLVDRLIDALVQATADSYIALIITKTYTDASFTRGW